jgi:hypothetical protein
MTENPENWDEALSAEHLEPRTTALDCIGLHWTALETFLRTFDPGSGLDGLMAANIGF